jgi:predicted metal-dependent hydrolase
MEEIDRIRLAKAEIQTDAEVGNLVFLRTLLAARIELYVIGEAKSQARKSGDEPAYQVQAQALRSWADQLDTFRREFPFPGNGYGQMLNGQLEIARDRARVLNNINAETVLQTLTTKVLEELERQEGERITVHKAQIKNSGLSACGNKVRIVDDLRGECIVTMRGYRKGAAGVLRRTIVESQVSIHKILSMFDHMTGSEEAEKRENRNMAADLREIARDPILHKDRLKAAYLGGEQRDRVRNLRDYGKIKARTELWAALQLLNIPTEQARGLASSLIELAAQDHEKRNEIVAAKQGFLTAVKFHAEELIGEVLRSFARRWTRYFANRPKLTPKTIIRIQKKLGKYLGTLLSREVREPWFRQARSRVTGVLRAILKFSREGGDEREVALGAARHLLGIEFDFEVRHREFKKPAERKAAWLEFLRRKVKDYGQAIIPPDKPADRQTELGF